MSPKSLTVSTFTLPTFDYQAIDSEVSDFARQAVVRIKAHERAAAVDIGRELIAVKERLPHGRFLPWIEAEFGWTRRTAVNMMQVAQVFGDDWEKIAHLPRSLQYQIASPSAPQAIRDTIHNQDSTGLVDPVYIKQTIAQARKLERQIQDTANAGEPARQANQESQDAQASGQEQEAEKARDAAQRIRAMLGDRLSEFQVIIDEFGSSGFMRVMQALAAQKVEP